MKEAAASEVAKVNQEDGGKDDKVNNKQSKPKPKQSSHKTKEKQKGSSSSKMMMNNLDEYFSLSQDRNSQGTADVTPTEPPKESEGTESKDEPKHPSHRDVHKSPQAAGGEGSPEPSSKSKGSPQPAKKP